MTPQQYAVANELEYWEWEPFPPRKASDRLHNAIYLELNPDSDPDYRDLVFYILQDGEIESFEFTVDADWIPLTLSIDEVKRLIKKYTKLAVFR